MVRILKILAIITICTGCTPQRPQPRCEPATCESLGATCGQHEDGCGEVLDCGACSDPCTETDSAFCVRLGAQCGQVKGTDACGHARTVTSCGSCVLPEMCGAAKRCACVAESNAQLCVRLGKTCGALTATDNCGQPRTIASCGSCPAGQLCGASGACICTPESNAQLCVRLGKTCGALTATDNCGQPRTVASCGACMAPATCGGSGVANVCGAPGCVAESNPTFCARYGKSCGSFSATDNCGQPRTVASCGGCLSPQSCGGSGTPNVCGCTPESDSGYCARWGKNCGTLNSYDNCSVARTAVCGSCAAPQLCGGGGVTNVCGCTPESNAQLCARLGKSCGALAATDNCGASRMVASCGACSSPQSCGGAGTPNVCGCTAESDAAFCSVRGASCGTLTGTDTCSKPRSASCGSCAGFTTCGGGGTGNVCGCTPENNLAFCERIGKSCGTVSALDNCGVSRTAACGGCAPSSLCTANVCTPYSEPFDPICNPEGWCWENPLPLSATLKDAWVSSPSDILVVGSSSTLLHYDGARWSGSFDARKPNLNAIWASSPTDLWIAGDRATLLHGPASALQPVTPPVGALDFTTLFGLSASDVWVADAHYAHHLSGGSWTSHSLPGITAIWGAAGNDVWAAGNGFLARWNGSTWTKQTGISWSFTDLHGFAANDIWALASGHVLRWNGSFWSDVASDTCTSMWGSSSSNLWLTCEVGIKRFDGTVFNDVPGPRRALRGHGTTPLVAFGNDYLGRYVNGQWVQVALSNDPLPTNSITSLQVFSDGTALAHTNEQRQLIRSAGRWSARSISTSTQHAVWGTSIDDYWIGGFEGGGGFGIPPSSFARHVVGATVTSSYSIATLTFERLIGLWGSGANDIHGIDTGRFFHWDGTSWSMVKSDATDDAGATSYLQRIHGASASDVWATDNTTTIWRLVAGAWQRFTSGSPLVRGSDAIGGLWVQSPSKTWFTGNFGLLVFDSASGYGSKQPVPAPVSGAGVWVLAVRQSSRHGLVAVGHSSDRGVVWRWDGSAWKIETLFPRPLFDLELDGTDLVATGYRQIFRKR